MSACPAPDQLTSLALAHLDPAEAARLQGHVARCPGCREALEAWTEVLGLLPLAEQPSAPPPELKLRLLGALEARQPTRLLPRLIGLVATFALLLGGYAIWRIERIAPETVALKGVGLGEGAVAQVALYSEGKGTRVAITASGLPPLGDDEVYRLWVLNKGERKAVCTFKVDGSGHGESTYWLPDRVRYEAMGVTREPDGAYRHEPLGPKVLGS